MKLNELRKIQGHNREQREKRAEREKVEEIQKYMGNKGVGIIQ